jgi:rhodanese-related sulfurtransferase
MRPLPYLRRTIAEAVALGLIALGPALLSAGWHPRRPEWTRPATVGEKVAWRQVQQWAENVLLVDARAEASFARGHIPGALWLDEAQWERGLPGFVSAWKPGVKVVVYCDGGNCGAAEAVAKRLHRELVIENIYVLEGGWNEWQRGGR